MKKVEHDVTIDQPAKEVWRVWIKNLQASLPRLVPEHYKSIEYLDGPPLAPGGVFRVNYAEEFGHFDYFIGVWDEIDHEKYSFRIRIFEGGHLGKHSSVTTIYSVQLLPGPTGPGSCTKKWAFEYDEAAEDKVHELLKHETFFFAEKLHAHLSSKPT